MQQRHEMQNRFLLTLAIICTSYIGFELFFNAYAMITVDEFWFAHRIYQYKNGLPYRDFAPYKTVLGYYILLLPMLLTKGIFPTLVFMKNTIAVVNGLLLYLSSVWLARFFSPKGVLISLATLVCSDLFLVYSTHIRVDLIGYWFCLFSLLFLLEKRYLYAGLLIGLGFITTQKVIWYVIASNAAMTITWLVGGRQYHTFKNMIKFNLSCILVVIIYMVMWSQLSSWNTVTKSVFGEAAIMYQLASYESGRKLFWSLITFYNPFLFLSWPLAWLSLMVITDNDKEYANRLFVVSYASTIILMLIPYKQVFPYYMQVTIPAFLVLYSSLFSWLIHLFQSHSCKLLVSTGILWFTTSMYIGAMICMIVYLQLPIAYLILCLMPLTVAVYITKYDPKNKVSPSISRSIVITSLVIVSGVYTPVIVIAKLFHLDGTYQRNNIIAMQSLLNDGSDYLAGIELLYNKTQPIPGMRHLGLDAVNYLYTHSAMLRPVMLASLYADPNATIDTVISTLQRSSVKLYMNNYRMMAIPPAIKSYLHSQYEHLWGSIYLYAPMVTAGNSTFILKFSGKYVVKSSKNNNVTLNHVNYQNNQTIYLKKNTYQSNSNSSYRLKLVPTEWVAPTQSDNNDDWNKMIY